jgi:hypothetical protein
MPDNPLELVRLRGGGEEPAALVAVTLLNLKSLLKNHPIAFYELAHLARNRDHRLFGNTGEALRARGLTGPDNHLHDSLRAIIKAAVDGDGMEMALRNPREEATP